MPRESKIVIGRPAVEEPAEHVFAYGDSDDAPRLVALLAARIRRLVEPHSQAAQDAAICLEPRTPWRTRLGRLAAALDDTVRSGKAMFVLWDADALAFEQPESFDAERASLLRRDLFRVIRESALEGGWVLVRTARAGSSSLDELNLPRELGIVHDASAPMPEQAMRFATECQPLATWLVANDVLRPRDLSEIKRTVVDADAHLVDLVYQELPGPVRDAVKLMSALRPPQPLNGHYGRLAFGPDTTRVTERGVSISARDALTACGLIQPTVDGAGWRMPRLIRERLYHLAERTLAGDLEQLHRLEAEVGTQAGAAVDDAVEAHHHAVLTGDIELATRTATYYGSELCEVARLLSMEAQDAPPGEKKALFRRAADLYRYILAGYDETDAYAWEYRGYNLARADGDAGEVLEAYRRAHQLRPRNPLYHGRLVGFRGQLGEHVVADAIAGIREYAQDDPLREPVAYFAKTVFDGLRRGGRRDQERAIVEKCRDVLVALAPRLSIDAS